jgi:hypothetical protein
MAIATMTGRQISRTRSCSVIGRAPDTFPVKQITPKTGCIRKLPEFRRVIEKIDKLAGPRSGECKSIYGIAVVKLLQVPVGHVFIAADNTHNIPSQKEAVASDCFYYREAALGKFL